MPQNKMLFSIVKAIDISNLSNLSNSNMYYIAGDSKMELLSS